MLFGIVLALALTSVPLAGGRLTALADVRLRAVWLVLAAIVLQTAIITVVPGGSPWLHRTVHVASYVLLAVFLVVNRRFPYVWLVALGGALNVLAIVANGGVMPASARALEGAGMRPELSGFTNSTALSHPHLLPLGDVFWAPAWMPGANVFSVGDVLILLGAFLALHRICGSRLPGRRRAAPAEPVA